MRFGIHLIQQNITLAECRDLWRWADTAGFDWFDVSDHFYESPMTEKRGPYLECLACLAALACDTQHMRIGTVVLAMDYRDPAVLAKALAASDHLSGGRLEAGFGTGWNRDDFRAYGIPFERIRRRTPVLEEGLQVVRMHFEQPSPSFDGRFEQLRDALYEPKPLQSTACNSGSAATASGARCASTRSTRSTAWAIRRTVIPQQWRCA